MDPINKPEHYDFLEKGRNVVLSTGYDYVVWKSRIKKNAISLKRRVLLFYF
ncbi:hypothetical protein [Maribacter antarcticus]|uniref:hypothetical protein n=1 Tax=Maribacter antarcticus TaxID=505250 RepID=UPI000ABB8536|nr:hypothetical protein [Maribacter antarcticus]